MCQHGVKETIKILFLFALHSCNSLPVSHSVKNISVTDHLKSKVIQDICFKKDSICSSYTYKTCAVRQEHGLFLFKEFSNDCFLFLVNMCEYPGNEWAIVDRKPCIGTNLRRVEGNETQPDSSEPQPGSEDAVESAPDSNVTGSDGQAGSEETPEPTAENNSTDGAETAPALRTASTASTTHYDFDIASDGHKCPQHCPLVYQPVCVNINRGYGKYFRLLHFSNHCEADRHYCTSWETAYQPPAGLDEPLPARPSNAAWSFCASGSYMNFMTFAQTATSMAHYGWLSGQQRAQHIMEPYERIPDAG